jgi:bifunctional ADP-heptose synthase (sugar kinase/adenylyltransferase)
VEQEISNLHAIIFSDFSYGFFDQDLTKSIIQLARKHSVFTSADSQTSSQIGDLTKFVGVDLVTPTEKEARHELRDERSGLVQIAEGVQKKLECKNVLLKLGSDGVLLHGINANGKVLRTDRVDALNGSPVDVSGAGDSLLAGATLAMISGASIYGAALIGSIAAAVQVSRVGNTPITIDEIQQGIINL